MTRPDIKLPLRIKRVCLDEAMGGSFGIVDMTLDGIREIIRKSIG